MNIDKDIEKLKWFNDGFTFKQCETCSKFNEEDSCCNKEKCEELQAIENVLKELEIKDKIIDLMAEKLAKHYLSYPRKCTLKEKENIKCDKFENCTECVKQYFEKKVESEK